jgi:hypothetical protein
MSVPSSAAPSRARLVRAILDDGVLGLDAAPEIADAVSGWLPCLISGAIPEAPPRGWIRVERAGRAFAPPSEPHRLELRSIAGWFQQGDQLLMSDPEGRVSGVVDLPEMEARIHLELDGSDPALLGPEIFSALTLAAAMLLGRTCRTLVHAGGIVGRDGRAWLLSGGTFSGKTTTCLNLIRSGWDYLADDQVVLRSEASAEVAVEGWPRRFNVDDGYAFGVSRGVRRRVDPGGFGPGRWVSRAPLGGLLFPRVRPEEPTSLVPLGTMDALAGILRQAPWLLGDPAGAPELLSVLQRAAARPAYRLSLGSDCYADPTPLVRLLDSLTAPG